MVASRMFGVVLALSLAACGMTGEQRAAVGSFARAAKTFGASTAEAFPDIRNAVIEMNILSRSLPGEGAERNFRTYGFKGLDGPLQPEDLERPVKLAGLLKQYGASLEALMAVGSADEIKPIFDSLAGNLKSFPGMGAEAKAALDRVPAAGTSLVSLAAEEQKRKLLRDIVPKFDPAIRTAASLLADEFSSSVQFAAAYGNALNRLDTTVRQASEGAVSPAERVAVMSAAELVLKHREKLAALQKSVPDAAASMAKAHTALVAAMEESRFSFDALFTFAQQAETVYGVIAGND